MKKKTNRLLAIKYLTESVYRAAHIEGINMDYPEVQTVCDGYGVSEHTVDEVNIVYSIKKAYNWILDNIDSTLNTAVLCKINSILSEHLDNATNITFPEIIDNVMASITESHTLEDALNLFCAICKRQLFSAHNLSTAVITTNMYMIQNGLGILSIPVNLVDNFRKLSETYYEDDLTKSLLIDFLKENCLTGT